MPELTERGSVNVLSPFTQPSYPTGVFSGEDRPEYAVVREIDYKEQTLPGSGGVKELTFYFSRHSKNVKLADDPYKGDFRKLLLEVCTNAPGKGESKPGKPFNSPLSLLNDKLIYVIYRLSEDKNWQFSREGPPITVGQAAHDLGTYYDAFRVDKGGYADRGTDPKFVRDGCRVAHFIADGAKIVEQAGCYSHPINLHVDLIWTEGGREHYMPIIIDPDVRYPGGSSEPP
ncbi:MAG TPA: nucleotide synthetase [Allosphingosinicella sp.]|nr:nucleotide synthetase [Allosphingosinicella sp.]